MTHQRSASRPVSADRNARRAGPSGGGTAGPATADVIWIAPFHNAGDEADEARAFVNELTATGTAIAAKQIGAAISGLEAQLEEDQPHVAASVRYALDRRATNGKMAVIHVIGGLAQRVPGPGPTVIRTMHETDGLPALWVEKLNTVDEVWVPTRFNQETFRSAGVTTGIHVVPGGIDSSWFRPDLPPLALPTAASTTFLSVFDGSHRQASDVLLQAWAEAFSPSDDVVLVLRCSPRSTGGHAPTIAQAECAVDAELAAVGRGRSDVAPIVVLDRHLSPDAFRRLVAGIDVYVSPARGEGWGRLLLAAQACGNAVITTNWGVPPEILDPGATLLIDVEKVAVVDDTQVDVDHYRGQRWALPSTGHLVELLRWTSTHPDERRVMGRRGREDMVRRWSWGEAAAVAHQRIAALTTPSWDRAASTAAQRLESLTKAYEHSTKGSGHSTTPASSVTMATEPPPGDATLEGLTSLMADAVARLEQAIASHQVAIDAVTARTERLERSATSAWEMAERWSRVPFCALPDGLRVLDATGRSVVGFRRPPGSTASGTLPGVGDAYLAFEDVFRGSSARVRELVRPYAALLADRRRVVELGCGRGELLGMLAEAGVRAVGVDSDQGMLSRARERGLEVVEADLLEYLTGQPDNSADGIVAVEVVEHLDPAVLPDFLAQARRVLEPGGVLLAETVNPHNLTAHKLFWLDPTHRHPLFPETLVVLAAGVGFDEATITFPDTTGDVAADLVACDRYTLVASISSEHGASGS